MAYIKNKINVLFWLRKKESTRKAGLKYIYMRITHEGQRWETSTGIKVKPEQWDDKLKYVKKSALDEIVANSALKAIKYKMDRIYADLLSNGIEITMDKIKFLFNGGNISFFKTGQKKLQLREVCQEFQNKNEMLIGAATLERYGTYIKRILEFVRIQYKQDNIPMDMIKLKFVDDLYMYCRTKLMYSSEGTKKLITFLKALVDYAVLHEHAEVNSIRSYRCAKYGSKKEVIFLNVDQLQQLYNHHFDSPRLSRTKDLFLFQCFTGLAYADLNSLSESNIREENGKLWIIKERQKSGVTSNIPLMPEAIQLLRKITYDNSEIDGKSHIDKSSKMIKCYTNQAYNRLLKEVGYQVGLEFTLTTHVARKTFATITLNKGNISIETVAKMLGHSNTKITQSTYSKVLNTRIEREMDNFSFIDKPTILIAS